MWREPNLHTALRLRNNSLVSVRNGLVSGIEDRTGHRKEGGQFLLRATLVTLLLLSRVWRPRGGRSWLGSGGSARSSALSSGPSAHQPQGVSSAANLPHLKSAIPTKPVSAVSFYPRFIPVVLEIVCIRARACTRTHSHTICLRNSWQLQDLG